jgi:hypothetical protein
VLLADGGDCLSDLAVLREQPRLFGPVASTPTAWRVVEQVACDPDGLAGLRAGRAHGRAAAWRVGAHVEGLVDRLRQRGVRFSVPLPANERVRAAVLAVPADAWQPAVDAGGQPRPGAEVADLHTLDLAGWPQGTRAICCREDPHPGAQLCFTDADGHRFQVFITDQPDPNVATLELRHRRRARIEDRIRCGKAAGLRNLPFDLLRRNQVWLELVLAAQDLLCWAQALLLDGDLKVAEPKTLRYRLLHMAARVVRHAHRLIIHLQRSWPRAAALAAAFARLRALPLRC